MNYFEVSKWSEIISSLLFIAVMVIIWVKLIQPAVLAAQEAHNKVIAEAERHRDEAKAALDALHQEIDGAKHDAEMIRKRAQEQASHETVASIAEARESGERALHSAQGELARARAAASEALRGELLELAFAKAGRDAEKRVDTSTNTRLVDRFVSQLERNSN
jgi:F0F1-type ATP synthase membrane subunit b/b'